MGVLTSLRDMLPSSTPSSYDIKRRHQLVHLLRQILGRCDGVIAMIGDYALVDDHTSVPCAAIKDTMQVARYELPMGTTPADYRSWWTTAPADAIPYTLIWQSPVSPSSSQRALPAGVAMAAGRGSLHRMYDTRTSLTIEWPLKRSQATAYDGERVVNERIARHQRVTLYDDGTLWLYNWTGKYAPIPDMYLCCH